MKFWIAIAVSALAYAAFSWWRAQLWFQKQIERSLKMVPFLITLPPESAEEAEQADELTRIRERMAKAESIFTQLASIYQRSLAAKLLGQRHLGFEIVAQGRSLQFYVVAPIRLLTAVEKAITSVYPDAVMTEAEEHNIFNKESEIAGVAGAEAFLRRSPIFPLRTYETLETDPLQSLINSMTKLKENEGAAVQLLIRPNTQTYTWRSQRHVRLVKAGKRPSGNIFLDTVLNFFSFFSHGVQSVTRDSAGKHTEDPYWKYAHRITPQEEEVIKAVTQKTTKPSYAVVVRLIASAAIKERAEAVVDELKGSFFQLNAPVLNSIDFKRIKPERVATSFIFRFFPRKTKLILNTEELASMYHLPELLETPFLKHAPAKKGPAPVELPEEGLVLGINEFRGEARAVRLTQDDKRRHVYAIGQTGTGKSTLLSNLILQDIEAGGGLCVIDPHGDLIETVLAKVPDGRRDDVILFDPGDLERPMGFNVFEAERPEQKDFLINEMINILYKLYDPGHTGIIGPRFEHWFRNAALTLMADPNGATLIEVPKVFVDMDFLRSKLAYVSDPIVLDFWTKEMAQTSDFHKSEILGWFSSKFGAFMSNEMMRNIIGQSRSAFNLREAMDSGKILLANLSKGRMGELNSQLLGMIFVAKIQAAAMSRVDIPEATRRDFTLYVDEFQDFATDSFASILSEARKYRLALVVANQFIGQLRDDIRDAVFGNVGTLIAFRVGPQDAEFAAHYFEPVFAGADLINVQNFNALIKLMIRGVPSRPFSLRGQPPLGEIVPERAAQVREASRNRYGRDRAEVAGEIKNRLGSFSTPVSASPPPAEDRFAGR